MLADWPNWAPDGYCRRDLDIFTAEDVAWLDRMWAVTGCEPRDPLAPDPATGSDWVRKHRGKVYPGWFGVDWAALTRTRHGASLDEDRLSDGSSGSSTVPGAGFGPGIRRLEGWS